MRKPSVLVSPITGENDFQLGQAVAAEQAAARLGIGISITFAENDVVNQSQQLLNVIHNKTDRPDAILVESVDTGMNMNQVAKAAVEAGIGWGIVNREVDYLPELRRIARAPVFAVTGDHREVCEIQANPFEAVVKVDDGGIL